MHIWIFIFMLAYKHLLTYINIFMDLIEFARVGRTSIIIMISKEARKIWCAVLPEENMAL